jgi:hypothetical protein
MRYEFDNRCSRIIDIWYLYSVVLYVLRTADVMSHVRPNKPVKPRKANAINPAAIKEIG